IWHQVDCGTSVDQHPVHRLAVDEALEIQSLQVLVAFLLGLLEDDRLWAEIQLRDGQFFRLGRPKLRWEHEHHIHISRWLLIGFCLLEAPLLSWRVPLLPSRSPDLLREIRTCLPQHVEVLCFRFFEIAQALHSALLRAIKPVRTPPWVMVPVFFFWLGISPGWSPHMIVLTCSRHQAPEHRCLILVAPSRPALQAIIYSRQSAHAGVPAIPEERAMPMVAYSLAPSQRPSRAVLVLVFFRFASAAQLVLVLVFLQEPIRSWELVADMTYLLFSHMLLLQLAFILRPFARSGLSLLLVMAAHRSHHVDLEC